MKYRLKIQSKTLSKALALSGLCISMQGQATELVNRTFCVFDILGKTGPVSSFMEDYRLQATQWGVNAQESALQ